MPLHGYLILAAGWILWLVPFVRLKKSREKPASMDRRARWGILFQTAAYFAIWMNPWVERDPGAVRFALAIIFFALGDLLSWTSVRSLGKQWRIEAGLNQDHELVRSGAYRFVRHPIYASMFAMFLASASVVALPLFFAIGFVLFIIGIEIRIRVEDGLLAGRFGTEFTDYRSHVAAYLPGIR